MEFGIAGFARKVVGGLGMLLLASAAVAQTTGRIDGRVLDPTGRTLSEAVVTASSSSLQGLRTAVSGNDGRFRLLALPPGDYEVVARHSGFAPQQFPGVRIWPDRTITLEVTLQPAFEEQVVVTARPPIIDTTDNATGASFDRETFSVLPLSRSPWWGTNAPNLAPGVTSGAWGYPEVRGASVTENRFLVDGIDVTDPYWAAVNTSLPPEFLENMEVKSGGYEPEYSGALGGMVNVVTRSGGNEFHGSAFGFYTGDQFQASRRVPEGSAGARVDFTEREAGFELGGKIVKDKLWYFLGWSPAVRDSRNTTLQAIDYTSTERRRQYLAKLTWQIDPDHRLVASAFGDPTRTYGGLRRNAAGRISDDWEYGGRSFSLDYQGRLGPALSVEATAGRFQSVDKATAISERSPLYRDRTRTAFWARQQDCGDPELLENRNNVWFAVGCEGGTQVSDGDDWIRDQLRASVSWLAASRHELKLGVEYRDVGIEKRSRYPSPFDGALVDEADVVVDPDGVPGAEFSLFPGFWRMGVMRTDSTSSTDEFGLFLQDRWRVTPYLTLNLGLRLDSFEATGMATRESPDQAIEFELDEMVAPRLGFVWDVSRRGRTKLFGSVARFYEAMPLNVNAIMFGNTDWVWHYFDYPSDGSLPTYENLGTYLSSLPQVTDSTVDPDLKPMHTNEYMLGFEFEAARDLAIGANLVYRELGNLVEDLTVDWGETFFVANPGKTYTENPVTGEPLPEPVVFPEAVREYRAMEVTARWQPRSRWQLFGTYVYSRNEGNYEGGVGLHLTPAFEMAPLLKYAEGPLPNDRRHELKVYGAHRFPFGLATGFSGFYVTGAPISKLGLGTWGWTRFVGPRGSAGRTSHLWGLDLHLEYPIRLRKWVTLTLIADVFNVTNEQRTIAVDEYWTWAGADETTDPNECGGPGTGPGTDCPDGNPFWGTPTVFQSPREIRFGTKLSW